MAQAPTKTVTRTRKKVKKNISEGIAHIHASFNNTIITITDRQGNALSWATSGGETGASNRITLLRDTNGDGVPRSQSVFLDHLNSPFGVALVGHDPDLGRWAGWFIAGQEKGIVTFKKGAACVIDFPAQVAAGKGVLYGHYQPGDLRKL